MKELLELHEKIVNVMPDHLKQMIKERTYFAGGCVRDLVRYKNPNDYDIFFERKEDMLTFCKYAESNKVFEKSPLGNIDWYFDNKKIQFITLVSGSPNYVVSKFDFNINQVYFKPFTKQDQYNYGSEIMFNVKTTSPISALTRINKFLKMGYTISEAQILKMAVVIANSGMITSQEDLEKRSNGISASLAINVSRIIEELASETDMFKALGNGNKDELPF
jgi:hypothetical protein